MSRLIPAALATLVIAGCASATAGGPGAVDGAASLVPGNAVAFVAASTDLTSGQWHAVGDVLLKGLERKTNLVWSKDLAPAAGEEVDVAVLPGNEVVALTQPHDEAKLAALAKKYDWKTRTVGDWTAIAETDAVLEELGTSAPSLAESKVFRAAMDRNPGDALVRAYVSGAKADELLASVPGQTSLVRFGQPLLTRPTGQTVARVYLRWAAVAVTDEKGGLKLEAVGRTGAPTGPARARFVIEPTAPYLALLADEIPADVLAVVDFPVPAGAFELMPQLPPPLVKLFGKNVFVDIRLDAILRGESALYVRAGLPIPEVTLVSQPPDTAAASTALDDLLAAVPTTSVLNGVTLHRAVIGGQFVVSTTQRGIDDFRGAGPKLSAAPAFLEARKLSGMQDETTGFAYVDATAALPLLRLAGVQLPADLPDLRALIAYGGQVANERRYTTFIQVGNG